MEKKNRNKVRVAFRRNRRKRARRRNLTRDVLENETASADELTGERVTGKGSLTRYRTIITNGDSDEPLREVDAAGTVEGRVLSAVGQRCLVQDDSGVCCDCTVRRVVRTLLRNHRNAVVTGDRVRFTRAGDDQGVIERVEPRHGVLSRKSGQHEHIIVSNVDQVLILASAAAPPLKTNLIDRFLASSENGGVRAIVCINKCDLVDLADLQPVMGLYGQLGYDVVATSALDGTGQDRLRGLLAGQETVLAGQSGVGKSSLLNAVQPELQLRTSDVSRGTGKGRHTTRRSSMIPLDSGGWVVDTPGIRQFQLWDVEPEEVEGFFVEFRPFVTLCRFPDCTHTHENDCGVKNAVAAGFISARRYESYLRMRDEE